MCIAIPPPLNKSHGAGRRWWNLVRSSPLRLLGFGAAIQLAGWLLLAALTPVTAVWQEYLLLLPLLPAAATLLLGIALERIPEALRTDAFHYPVYGGLFLLTTVGALLLLAGVALELPQAAAAGTALALLALVIGGRALWWKVKWSRVAVPGNARALLAALGAAGIGGLVAVYTLLVRT